ncbi:MAG: endolytic transglycosylase MltG [Alphaproteobacteria bacterium]|nr:endolytic transglycosylase MltG [Alphaproteobacteria bacterium]
MKKLLFLKLSIIIFGMAAVFLYSYAQKVVYMPHKVSGDVFVQIESGMPLQKIAKTLRQKNLINNSYEFILYVKFNKLYPKFKAGEYIINNDISIVGLSALFSEGKAYLRRLTIPEGLTSREAMEIILNNEYMIDDFTPFKDGEILPETYTFTRNETRQKLVNRAKEAMNKVLQQAWNEKDADLPLKNKEEMLILASIVEKETGVPSERPQVASVFINRLRKGMLLQTDPTVIYAITNGEVDLNRSLTRKDLEIDSPYNTYKYEGLPPTPICNPGKAAIMAVAHPDKTPYLYFVASGIGGHNFATTLEEHNQNVRKWKSRAK